MGYMKEIDIQAENVFEGEIILTLAILEKQINNLVKELEQEKNVLNQEVLIESIIRCYHVYSMMQIEFW